jgi:hypothetical protein
MKIMLHKCQVSKTCKCYLLASEPNEKCPIHGAGDWPPRCEICGQYMNQNPQKVYVITKEGVYRHEIVGVCSDLEKAKEIARRSDDVEDDNYHSFEIREFILGLAYVDPTAESHERFTDGEREISPYEKGGTKS